MKKSVSILLVGIGGYGNSYVSALLDRLHGETLKIVAAVDPSPQRCIHLKELQAMNIPLYKSLDEFYNTGGKADLSVISTPIHLHCSQTCASLSAGSNVLCEKPLAATVQEVYRMIHTRDKAEKKVAIGYQWSFSNAIQMLKKDIQKGLFGKPKRLKTVVLWPRSERYYNRSSWAGKKSDSEGNWILDSPVNNATAHHLHNMFYVLGKKKDTSAQPVDVIGELYRANDIQNYDTAALRVHTDSGVEILFYVSHAIKNAEPLFFKTVGPIFSYEFENATITHSDGDSEITAHFSDGTVKKYGSPSDGLNKLWYTIESVNGEDKILCGLEAASAHTLCMNGLQDSMPEITSFPESLINVREEWEGNRFTWVKDLDSVLKKCYREGLLPSELSIPWSKKGKEIKLTNYKYFPGGRK